MHTILKELHAHWCELTGQSPQELKYFACERLLYSFHNNGYTKENMTMVLKFLLHQNSKASHPKFRKPIRFHSIMEEETFASYLGEAGPWWRNRVKSATEKQKVLDQFRGAAQPSDTSDNTRRWGDVLQAIKLP